MLETVANGALRICLQVGPIQWLQEEVLEVQGFVLCEIDAGLWHHELEFVPTLDDQVAPGGDKVAPGGDRGENFSRLREKFSRGGVPPSRWPRR